MGKCVLVRTWRDTSSAFIVCVWHKKASFFFFKKNPNKKHKGGVKGNKNSWDFIKWKLLQILLKTLDTPHKIMIIVTPHST